MTEDTTPSPRRIGLWAVRLAVAAAVIVLGGLAVRFLTPDQSVPSAPAEVPASPDEPIPVQRQDVSSPEQTTAPLETQRLLQAAALGSPDLAFALDLAALRRTAVWPWLHAHLPVLGPELETASGTWWLALRPYFDARARALHGAGVAPEGILRLSGSMRWSDDPEHEADGRFLLRALLDQPVKATDLRDAAALVVDPRGHPRFTRHTGADDRVVYEWFDTRQDPTRATGIGVSVVGGQALAGSVSALRRAQLVDLQEFPAVEAEHLWVAFSPPQALVKHLTERLTAAAQAGDHRVVFLAPLLERLARLEEAVGTLRAGETLQLKLHLRLADARTARETRDLLAQLLDRAMQAGRLPDPREQADTWVEALHLRQEATHVILAFTPDPDQASDLLAWLQRRAHAPAAQRVLQQVVLAEQALRGILEATDLYLVRRTGYTDNLQELHHVAQLAAEIAQADADAPNRRPYHGYFFDVRAREGQRPGVVAWSQQPHRPVLMIDPEGRTWRRDGAPPQGLPRTPLDDGWVPLQLPQPRRSSEGAF